MIGEVNISSITNDKRMKIYNARVIFKIKHLADPAV
jgi:hypothetical protein